MRQLALATSSWDTAVDEYLVTGNDNNNRDLNDAQYRK